MKAIILAGGTGTRLWPMSRKARPKQFYDVVGTDLLIRDTYRRLLRLFSSDDIYFSISPSFDTLLRKEFPDVMDDHILIEPEKRDTGAAMGYVAALLELIDPNEPIVFIPSDHYIQDEELFLRTLTVGEQLVRETGKLVDIAITPTFPSTVLGYTHIGTKQKTIDDIDVYQFVGHKEKPEYGTAKSYLEDGSYLWHANYYMWTPAKFIEAFESYAPETALLLRDIQRAVLEEQMHVVADIYTKIPKLAFDYAITEKMDPKDVLILRGDFGWSDIGAWDTLYDRLSDEEENVTKGKTMLIDTHGSLVYAPPDKLVAVVGMTDIVVVDTGDALLICPRDQAQRVKEIVAKLEEDSLHELL